jgi:hypothetical protein
VIPRGLAARSSAEAKVNIEVEAQVTGNVWKIETAVVVREEDVLLVISR